MADYCNIEKIKIIPNLVYSEAQTKRQIDKPISKIGPCFFLSTARH